MTLTRERNLFYATSFLVPLYSSRLSIYTSISLKEYATKTVGIGVWFPENQKKQSLEMGSNTIPSQVISFFLFSLLPKNLEPVNVSLRLRVGGDSK